jgi:hypothetical protein
MRRTRALALAAGCSALLAACTADDAPRATGGARPQAAALDSPAATVDSPAAAPADSGDADPPAPPGPGCSTYEPVETPAELGPFVPAGKEALCAAAADLDGDGLGDYVLVVGNVRRDGTVPEDRFDPRALLVLVRQPGGALREAARGDRAVLCLECGGFFDPFEGVDAGPGTFTINHFGGSGLRWRMDFTFRRAPADGTWRLERVRELEYRSVAPETTMDSTVHTAPRLRAVDLAEFQADSWKRQALRDRS